MPLTLILIFVIIILFGVSLFIYGDKEFYKQCLKDRENDIQFYKELCLKTAKSCKRKKQLLKDIQESLYYGEDLKHPRVREFYKGVWENIYETIDRELKK